MRDLRKEFLDMLRIELSPAQYRLKLMDVLVENQAMQTGNMCSTGLPTADEALLTDPAVIQLVLSDSTEISDHQLADMAFIDGWSGGKGRANPVLAQPVVTLCKAYQHLPPAKRNNAIKFECHHLESNVPAVLREVSVPKYERIPFPG